VHLKFDPQPFRSVPAAVNQHGEYQPVSYWQTTVDVVPGRPLDQDLRCDVVIVGGGYSGLSVARHLKQLDPALDVIVLEHSVVGHGASGRNGGFAMPLLGWDLYQTSRTLGKPEAKRAYDMMYRAVQYVKTTIAQEAIDCDLECTGYLLVNPCESRARRAKKEMRVAHELGYQHRWLEGNELRQYIDSEKFLSGVFDPQPCIVNPAKLARGLKVAAEKLGVRIFEQTPLLELTDGDPVVIRTAGGTVRAAQVALCLNGFGAASGLFKNSVLPVHTYIVLTEPLTPGQLESIGMAKHRASIETARNFIHYFRLTADNRIAFGGEDVEIYPGGAFRTHDAGIEAALRRRFQSYFPSLRGVEFTHAWGGTLGVTIDMFPTFGQGGEHGNIFHACAYAGHGVSLSNYCGSILAPVMLRAAGRQDIAAPRDMPFFWQRKPFPLPPDPWRYWGMRAYRLALRGQDWLARA
jgi:glycine/D-amino acid oxidase-like deaminating enzyme